jgi:hypothetical protein
MPAANLIHLHHPLHTAVLQLLALLHSRSSMLRVLSASAPSALPYYNCYYQRTASAPSALLCPLPQQHAAPSLPMGAAVPNISHSCTVMLHLHFQHCIMLLAHLRCCANPPVRAAVLHESPLAVSLLSFWVKPHHICMAQQRHWHWLLWIKVAQGCDWPPVLGPAEGAAVLLLLRWCGRGAVAVGLMLSCKQFTCKMGACLMRAYGRACNVRLGS